MMFLVVGVLASTASLALAQSPHVYRRSPEPIPEVQLHHGIIGGIGDLGSRNAFGLNIWNTSLLRRADIPDGDPTGGEQEKGRPSFFPMPSCLWCPPVTAEGDPEALLGLFTTEHFIDNIRARRVGSSFPDLHDKCMFYTKAVTPGQHSLSRLATQLACKYSKYSIWVGRRLGHHAILVAESRCWHPPYSDKMLNMISQHLWPNQNTVYRHPERAFNFYGIFREDNIARALTEGRKVIPGTQKPYYIAYFENMSRAMAQKCTGQIYLLTQTPDNLGRYMAGNDYPNIWITTEWPALMNHLGLLTSNLIVIEATGLEPKPRAWSVNWQTLETGQQLPSWRKILGNFTGTAGNFSSSAGLPAGWEPYDLDQELKGGVGSGNRTVQKRDGDLCFDSGVDDEESQAIDFFG